MLSQMENLAQLYEQDYIIWLEKNITALKLGNFYHLDLPNLIEELESLGRSEKRAVESLLIQLILHLLIYEYWQKEHQYNAHHWTTEIINFRDQLQRNLTPTLYNHAMLSLDSLYKTAVRLAKNKTQLNCFPEKCKYSLTQILDQDYLPEIVNS